MSIPLYTTDPLTQPGYFDVFMAAGIVAPGVAKLMSGGEREYNWDIRQAPGLQGYRMTYRGYKAGDDIVVRFEFFERPDGYGYAVDGNANVAGSMVQAFYQDFMPIFAIDAQKLNPQPVVVYHPALASNNITQVVAKKIGPLQTDGQMRWWLDMTFLEFRPPRIIAASTPKGATDRLGVPTPQTKIQVEIQKTIVTGKKTGALAPDFGQ